MEIYHLIRAAQTTMVNIEHQPKGERTLKRILETPLLPQGKAAVAVSAEAEETIAALEEKGVEVFRVKPNSKLEAPVASHPDCNILQLDRSTFVCDEDITPSLVEYIQKNNIVNNLTIGQGKQDNEQVKVYSEKISSPYPGEVALNVKRLDNCVVCNTKNVCKTIQVYAAANDLNLYHCNQGYVGCSSVLISHNAAMTDDESVYDTFRRIGLDCLMLSKGQIKLSGYSYGFIGGCCGFIDKNLIAFNGTLSTHNDSSIIESFLSKYNVNYVELTDKPLTDIGGIVPIFEDI